VKVVIVLVVAVFEAIGDHLVDLVLNEIIRQFIKVEFKGIELSDIVGGLYGTVSHLSSIPATQKMCSTE
jgi:hypothetical protein